MTAGNQVLEAERIMVVAPHPDDELLGCGGLIAKLAARGRRFHIVFVTDGGASHRGSKIWPRSRLAARREEEALEALRRLGLDGQSQTFLRLRDADMPAPRSPQWTLARDALTTIVAQFRPDLILLPWRRDPHCDHRASWVLTREAVARAGVRAVNLEYAIWLDEFGAAADHPLATEARRLVIDVSREGAIKRFAVDAHVSQTSALIDDDPDGFRLAPLTLFRLCGPLETYWRPLDEGY